VLVLSLHVPTRIALDCRLKFPTAVRALPVQREGRDAQGDVRDVQECVGERGRGQLIVLRERPRVNVETQPPRVRDDDTGDVSPCCSPLAQSAAPGPQSGSAVGRLMGMGPARACNLVSW
jgi:hypothetical protein